MSNGTSATSLGSGSVSSSLLRHVKCHDPAAWRRFSSMLCPIVYRWARRAGLQSSDASDIVQEVFRSVAASIDSFTLDQPGSTFRGWLWTITQNKVRDHFRQAAGRPQAAGGTAAMAKMDQIPADASEDSLLPASDGTQSELVWRALDGIRADFEPSTWQAFWRSAIENQSTAQIAQELNLSPQGARQAKYRVLRRLRQELDGLSE